MTAQVTRQEILGKLRDVIDHPDPVLVRMIEAGPVVRDRFQLVFKPDGLPKLTKEDFQSFLKFRNNQHWFGLQRTGPEIFSDMVRLRTALGVLLDESLPIYQRLNDLQPGGRYAVPGMGRAVLSAILLVMYPDRYGVWNNTSQDAMKSLGLWPNFERGEPFGRRYVKVNNVLLDIARELGIDLWKLDGIWWMVLGEKPEVETDELAQVTEASEGAAEGAPKFGLERHLHEFLRDNWEKTVLGEEWNLYTEDGEVAGYEYRTDVGRIDLLAQNKKQKAWLVVELKRNQTSDETVGQALRYMGYVREHLAEKGDRIEGLIVAHRGDERIRYALSVVPNLGPMVYELDFRLRRSSEAEGSVNKFAQNGGQ